MQRLKKAFTLVELIVVITILAILGTIAFISLSGYSAQSRDSVRISDLDRMKTALELYQIDAGKYPIPTNPIDVTYSGATVWNQGTFGETVFANLSKLDKIPKDPLTDKEYTYSTTFKKNEYELGGILEGDSLASNKLSSETYAGTIEANAIIVGNYNGQMTKSLSGAICNILATPSIIASDVTTSTDLQTIVNSGNLVYRGFKNLPSSFFGSKFKQDGGFNFTPNSLLSYTDTNNCDALISKTSYTERVQLLAGLQNSYSGTILQNVGEIKNILSLDISDVNNPSNEVITYAGNFVNNSLGGKVVAGSISNSSSGGPDIIDFETEGGYTVSTGSFIRTMADKYEGLYSIESQNLTAGSISCFETNRTKSTNFTLDFDYKLSSGGFFDHSGVLFVNGIIRYDFYPDSGNWATYKDIFVPGTYNFKWCFYNDSGYVKNFLVDNIKFLPTNIIVPGENISSVIGEPVYKAGTYQGRDIQVAGTVSSSIKWKTANTSTPNTQVSSTNGALNIGVNDVTYTGTTRNTSHPAGDYCANLVWGGFNDWYIPAVDETFGSLGIYSESYDCSSELGEFQFLSCLDNGFNGFSDFLGFVYISGIQYWTSNQSSFDNSSSYYMDNIGNQGWGSKTNNLKTKCIRVSN